MNSLLLALLVALSPGPRAHAPVAAAAADTAYTTRFEVDGIPVILRHNTASEVVVANLYLLGGARQLTPSTAGTEVLLLTASERGTRRFPGATVRQRTARLGGRIAIESTDDWTAIGLHTIRANLDSTWAVFADRVMAPSLEPAEVALVRAQLISVARERRTLPDDAVTELADSLVVGTHPYAVATSGTPASLSSITVAQLKQYQAQQVVRSRMLLVVVGDVDRATIEGLVHASLGKLPAGSYRWTPPPPLPSGAASVVMEHRGLPTNYLLGYVPGPAATSRDYTALRVATAVLSGRLFSEVRSKRNLSYAVESPFLERAHALAGLYVTTIDPGAVLDIMRQELNTLQNEDVEAAGLRRLEQQFITEYYLKNETNADQANVLARAELYQGDYRAADRFMSELRRITPADVRSAARRYLRDFRFAYVGDTTRIDRNRLLTF